MGGGSALRVVLGLVLGDGRKRSDEGNERDDDKR